MIDERVRTIAVLDAVRDLLINPVRWCRESWARTHTGYAVYPQNPGASCWCIVGAVERVTTRYYRAQGFDLLSDPALRALRSTLKRLDPERDLVEYNEETSHEAVLELIDLTLKDLKETL